MFVSSTPLQSRKRNVSNLSPGCSPIRNFNPPKLPKGTTIEIFRREPKRLSRAPLVENVNFDNIPHSYLPPHVRQPVINPSFRKFVTPGSLLRPRSSTTRTNLVLGNLDLNARTRPRYTELGNTQERSRHSTRRHSIKYESVDVFDYVEDPLTRGDAGELFYNVREPRGTNGRYEPRQPSSSAVRHEPRSIEREPWVEPQMRPIKQQGITQFNLAEAVWTEQPNGSAVFYAHFIGDTSSHLPSEIFLARMGYVKIAPKTNLEVKRCDTDVMLTVVKGKGHIKCESDPVRTEMATASAYSIPREISHISIAGVESWKESTHNPGVLFSHCPVPSNNSDEELFPVKMGYMKLQPKTRIEVNSCGANVVLTVVRGKGHMKCDSFPNRVEMLTASGFAVPKGSAFTLVNLTPKHELVVFYVRMS